MQIYLDNVGCRLNWSEIEMLARQLVAVGHTIVAKPAQADLIIVNTCAVTAQAERKTRHCLRSLHRRSPEARIAVVGCYATLRPGLAAGFPGVEWVISNSDKERACDILRIDPLPAQAPSDPERNIDTLRTRAFVKVQDGCDHHCTYCIVRCLRGGSRSRPLDEVLLEVQRLSTQADSREIVLTGASLGAYGRDIGLLAGLRVLVEAILTQTDVGRLRLSSLEPWHVDETFLELWDDPRMCRQVHLPLQAGHNTTLRRMGRPITTAAFERLVTAARERIPDVAVTTDLLVGFPGETEETFRKSCDFVERMKFAKVHVFPYSERPGTPAAKLPEQVPRQVRDDRARQVRDLATRQRDEFRHRFVGRQLPVLWEKQRHDGRWTGWSDNYLRVVASSDRDLCNRITSARILSVERDYLEGETTV